MRVFGEIGIVIIATSKRRRWISQGFQMLKRFGRWNGRRERGWKRERERERGWKVERVNGRVEVKEGGWEEVYL